MHQSWAETAQNFLSGWAGAAADLLAAASDSEEEASPHGAGPLQEEGHQEPMQNPDKTPQTPAAALEALRSPGDGWATAPLREVFKEVLSACDPISEETLLASDADIAKVAAFYFDDSPMLHSSKVSIGRLCGVPPEKLEPALTLIVNALLHLERERHCQLEQTLVSDSTVELVSYVELSRYDETPMKVTQVHGIHDVQDTALPEAPGPSQSEAGKGSVPPSSSGLTFRAASVAKMFSTQTQVALLVKCEVQEEQGAVDQLVGLITTTSTWNQLLSRATGECLAAALQETSPISHASTAFGFRARVSTTDQAPANLVAERLMLQLRGEGCAGLHLFCNVHQASTCMKKSMTLFEEDISGLVNCSLCLSVGASMLLFRRALTAVIRERLVIVREVLPPQASHYQDFVLALFGSTGTKIAERRHLLKACVQSDWRVEHEIRLHIPPGLDFDEAAVVQDYVESLVFALSHKNFATFPRHRWLGCDVSIDQVGLALSVHGLGRAALQKLFAATATVALQHPARRVSGLASQSELTPEEAADTQESGQVQPQGTQAGFPLPTSNTPMHAAAETEGTFTEAGGIPEAGSEDFAAINSQRQRIVSTWLETRPLAHLMIVRLCIQPLVGLLRSYIARSGQHWQARLVVDFLKGRNSGLARSSTGPVKDYIALRAEGDCLEGLKAVMESSVWQWVPRTAWTWKEQGLAFCLGSRIGCLVKELLVRPTRSCPLTLFRAIDEPGVIHDIAEAPACCKDAFTTAFLKKFYTPRGLTEEGMATLRLVSQAASCETVGLEWGHGRVHRLITAQKAQTHVPSMPFINGQWVCQRYCAKLQFARNPGRSLVRQARLKRPAQRAAPQQAAKRRRGGGGSWRAFISLTQKGRRGPSDFRAVSREYRAAIREGGVAARQAEQVGAAAAAVKKATGRSGLGPPLRQIRRSRAAEALRLGGRRVLPSTASAMARSTAGDQPVVFPQPQSLQTQLRVVRAEAKRQSRVASIKQQEEQALIQEFQQEEGPALVEAGLSGLPELLTLAPVVRALPHPPLQCLELSFDRVAEATAIATWSHKHSRTSNLKLTLEEDWSRKNRVIFPAPQQAGVGTAPEVSKSACLQHGVCVQSPGGKKSLALRNAFLRELKSLCPRSHAHNRACLLQGHVFFCLKGTAPSTTWSGWAHAAESLLAESQPKPLLQEGEHWYRVGLHYLKPYRPTLTKLQHMEALEDNKHVLRQRHNYLCDMEAFSAVDTGSHWQLRFFRLVATPAPVWIFDPRVCQVEPFATSEFVQLWPRPKRIATRRSRASLSSAQGVMGGRDAAADREGSGPAQEPLEASDEEAVEESDAEPNASSESEASHSDVSQLDLDLEGWLTAVLAEPEPDLLPASGAEAAEAEQPLQERDVARQNQEPAIPLRTNTSDHSGGSQMGPPPAAEDAAGEPPTQDPAAPALLEMGAEPAPEVRRQRAPSLGLRLPAEYSVEVVGGRLAFYAAGFFTATCRNPRHGRCVMTRSSQPGGKAAQGRPLGLLMSWLQRSDLCLSKEEHWNKESMPSLEQRTAARNQLASVVGGQTLLAFERPKRPGEADEPEAKP